MDEIELIFKSYNLALLEKKKKMEPVLNLKIERWLSNGH